LISRLLVELETGVVVMVVMVVVGMNNHHNLRLRRVRYCEAEEKHESEQNLFHNTVSRPPNQNTELL
jgi:hypothetical protein